MGPFTAVYEQHGDWWIGCMEEIPGTNSELAQRDSSGDAVIRETVAVALG